MKVLKKVITTLFLIIILAAGVKFTAMATDTVTSSAFRLEKVEGSAEIINDKGKSIAPSTGMLFYSGDKIRTGKKSYAYISLDGSKVLKLDELSQVSVSKSGKKLLITLEEGALYFEVNSKLDSDESMVVSTQAVALSIRGTAGAIRKRTINGSIQDTVWLLEGRADLYGIGAAAGREVIHIWGGERIDYVESSGLWTRDLINMVEIPGFVDFATSANQDVLGKMRLNSGLDTEWIVANAPLKLGQDQSYNDSHYGNVFTDMVMPTPAPAPILQTDIQPVNTDAEEISEQNNNGETGETPVNPPVNPEPEPDPEGTVTTPVKWTITYPDKDPETIETSLKWDGIEDHLTEAMILATVPSIDGYTIIEESKKQTGLSHEAGELKYITAEAECKKDSSESMVEWEVVWILYYSDKDPSRDFGRESVYVSAYDEGATDRNNALFTSSVPTVSGYTLDSSSISVNEAMTDSHTVYCSANYNLDVPTTAMVEWTVTLHDQRTNSDAGTYGINIYEKWNSTAYMNDTTAMMLDYVDDNNLAPDHSIDNFTYDRSRSTSSLDFATHVATLYLEYNG